MDALPELNDAEARVLGVLIEKALTTPDHYPLSINALLNGANQKSNRFPVTSYVEAEVVVALQGLVPKGLAGRVVGAGSRVEKFRHTANGKLDLDDAHVAILAELLLRGPQMPGELRARVHRMAPTPKAEDLKARLELLVARGFARRLPPAPGSRAERYEQLLSPGLHALPSGAPTAALPATEHTPPAESRAASDRLTVVPSAQPEKASDRLERLERLVGELRRDLDALRAELG